MRQNRKLALLSFAVSLFLHAGPLYRQDFNVPPQDWHPSRPDTCRLETLPDGNGVAAVTGNGQDASYWLSDILPLTPGQTYRFSLRLRGRNASGGTATTGPVFANLDAGAAPDDWTRVSGIFAVPHLSPDAFRLRVGHWHGKGDFLFDDLTVTPVQPLYVTEQGLTLGEGEKLHMNDYVFNAPFGGQGRNHARPLHLAKSDYNSTRWTFGAGSEVIYRHHLNGRRQLAARLEAIVNYHVGGRLEAHASADGQTWLPLASIDHTGQLAADIPKQLLPADAILIRLRSANAAGDVRAQDSDPGSFQVNRYTYSATVDGPPVSLQGSTTYISVMNADPSLAVTVRAVGDGLPGQPAHLDLAVTNRSDRPRTLRPATDVRLQGPASDVATPGAGQTEGSAITVAPGATVSVRLPYAIPAVGTWDVTATLAPDCAVAFTVHVPAYFDASYGELLQTDATAAVWSASSGWKIHPRRAIPTRRGTALSLSLAANEAEAVQLVIAPRKRLSGLTLACSELRSADGHAIPAASVELLRVHYHDIQVKTDRSGVLGLWPDALPPIDGPLTLEPNRQHPLWLRVTAPKGTRPGLYRGTVALRADGWRADIPVECRVYGFELPDRMTCQTAFGFSPAQVWRYHNVQDPQQRRQLLHTYFTNFAKHHISPYNPAPLDPLRVSLERPHQDAIALLGGVRDTTEPFAGKASLRLTDTSTTANVEAKAASPIDYPPQGVTVSLRYRTSRPGHTFLVTMLHFDRDGNWMSGRNRDLKLTGDGSWQRFTQSFAGGPAGATAFQLVLRPALWADDGATTGDVRFDEIRVTDNATGQTLLRDDSEPTDASALALRLDTQAWDAAMAHALRTYHFNSFSLPVQGLGGGTFHARHEPSFLGFPGDSPEYASLHPRYLKRLQEHLDRQGLLDYAYVYWFDEPDPKDYAFVMDGFRKLRESAPRIRRMLTEQVEPDLIGGPNLWCPVSSALDPATVPTRKAAGDDFWWYVCTGPKTPYATLFIDHPGTEMRVWLWQTWQYGVSGILVWATNYWTSSCAYPDAPQNPYADPMSWVSGYSFPKGAKSPWGNGDGRFIYPPLAAADAAPGQPNLDPPVDSLRWEMLRDGIEDYEYFVILKRLLDERGSALPADTADTFRRLLDVPRDVSESRTVFTTDPAPIERHRDRLAHAIETLLRIQP